MATVKKGILTRAGEWAKHLRPWGKREFWGGERRAAEADVKAQIAEVEGIRAINAEIDWLTESQQIKFSRSCGCVFCDVNLNPSEDGYHWVGGEAIFCHRAG